MHILGNDVIYARLKLVFVLFRKLYTAAQIKPACIWTHVTLVINSYNELWTISSIFYNESFLVYIVYTFSYYCLTKHVTFHRLYSRMIFILLLTEIIKVFKKTHHVSFRFALLYYCKIMCTIIHSCVGISFRSSRCI